MEARGEGAVGVVCGGVADVTGGACSPVVVAVAMKGLLAMQ